MTRYYARTFGSMAIVLVVAIVAAIVASSAANDATTRLLRLSEEDRIGATASSSQRARLTALQQCIEPVHAFAAEWKSTMRLPEKEAAEHIRSEIEAIAQRQLGLVTDNAITPQPDRFIFQGLPMRVQRVTLRASGKDLVALLTWLGKVEERYPAALVESCDFVSNVGGNTGLTIRLVQPLSDATAKTGGGVIPIQNEALRPEAIAAMAWRSYLPTKLKPLLAIGFSRNPLQPAVTAGQQTPVVSFRDATDEIGPRLEMSLSGKLRSVIHGSTPLIVVDGHVFHPGDEVTLGAGRERPVSEAKTKLKEITRDRLIFHVAGGTADKPIQCDIAYALPAFLCAR